MMAGKKRKINFNSLWETIPPKVNIKDGKKDYSGKSNYCKKQEAKITKY